MQNFKQVLLNKLDPHKQSCFYFSWKPFTPFCLLVAAIVLTVYWKSVFVDTLLNNIFVYAPNYLTHEMLGHNLVGNIFFRLFYIAAPELGKWIHALAGNAVETLLPLGLLIFALRLDGGRWLLPPLTYWLASSFYGAGVYVQDARACSLPLTSSDMMTNYKPGEICGDWHYILEPLGLLNFDQWFAYTFLFIASFLCLLAFYSAYYYWTHSDQYLRKTPIPVAPAINEDWTPPSIYNGTPRAENFPGGKQE